MSLKGKIIRKQDVFNKIILIVGGIMSLCKGTVKIGKKILKGELISIFLRDI